MLARAFDHWPHAIAKRKSGPRRAMQKRLSLSRNGWYHLSLREPTLGYTETQQQRSMVAPQLQRMSTVPLSLGPDTQPSSGMAVALPILDMTTDIESRKLKM